MESDQAQEALATKEDQMAGILDEDEEEVQVIQNKKLKRPDTAGLGKSIA